MSGTNPGTDILNWFRSQRWTQNAARFVDGAAAIVRGGQYGEMVSQLVSSKQHLLADEGSYFVTRSPTPGTGIATIAALSSYADTSPFVIITNNNPVGGRSIYLDYIQLRTTVAGTNGTNLLYATKLDLIPRYSSGGVGGAGTGMTAVLAGPYACNTQVAPQSGALVYAGAIVAVASSLQARTLSNGPLRTAISVVNDTYLFNFGGCDMMLDGVLVSGAAVAQRSIPHAPVCIGPQGSFLLHIWSASQSVAANYEIEIGHVER
jgi:hypothetical protein